MGEGEPTLTGVSQHMVRPRLHREAKPQAIGSSQQVSMVAQLGSAEARLPTPRSRSRLNPLRPAAVGVPPWGSLLALTHILPLETKQSLTGLRIHLKAFSSFPEHTPFSPNTDRDARSLPRPWALALPRPTRLALFFLLHNSSKIFSQSPRVPKSPCPSVHVGTML